MENVFTKALHKVVTILEKEKIDYMLVGGFAVSYHNRARTTNDIDIVLQIYPSHVRQILAYFPEWKNFEHEFTENVQKGMLFNITDFDTGIRYDFISYQDSDYNWVAFNRREKVVFFDVPCFVCSKEDLVISKIIWYTITPSDKQMEDVKFLLLDKNLNTDYIRNWLFNLNIKANGFLES